MGEERGNRGFLRGPLSAVPSGFGLISCQLGLVGHDVCRGVILGNVGRVESIRQGDRMHRFRVAVVNDFGIYEIGNRHKNGFTRLQHLQFEAKKQSILVKKRPAS